LGYVILVLTSVPKEFKVAPLFEQQKELEAGGSSVGKNQIEIIYSRRFIEYCISYFERYDFVFPGLFYQGKRIIDIKEKWLQSEALSFEAGYKKIPQMIESYCENYFLANKPEIVESIRRECGEDCDRSEVERRFRIQKQQFILTAIQKFKSLNRENVTDHMIKILQGYSETAHIGNGLKENIEQSVRNKRFRYEEAMFYLLVKQLMGKNSADNNVKQVLIDEVQDCNLIQLQIIRRMYPRAGFTFLADINQAVQPVTSIQNFDGLESIFDGGLEKVKLFKSYRSTGPINALAFQLIKTVSADEEQGMSYFKRSGKKPEVVISKRVSGNLRIYVEKLDKYNFIAIIVSNYADAAAAYNILKDRGDVQLIYSGKDEIRSRIVVIPLLLAKGLEFDAVIALNCLQNSGDYVIDRRRAYLAATRALHELFFLEKTDIPDMYEDCLDLLQVIKNE